MRETSTSPIRVDPAHPSIPPRRDLLSSEARRLARRRAMALAVAARCRRIAEESFDPEAAITVSTRAMKRASRLHVRFHRTLDSLVAAGGFDEALAIVRERKPS
jgi:hypothetical protein